MTREHALSTAPNGLAGPLRHAGLDLERARAQVGDALFAMDDGELFLERSANERLVFDEGTLKSATRTLREGFGLRAVAGEAGGLATAETLSHDAIAAAAKDLAPVALGARGRTNQGLRDAGPALYGRFDPTSSIDSARKVALLEAVDRWVRARDPAVRQVSVTLQCDCQAVDIIRADGRAVSDLRPLVRFDVSVTLERAGRRETAAYGGGGRYPVERVMEEGFWQKIAAEALRQAHVRMEAVDAPAGEMTVVLGPGWPGVMLHEAVGHGLEGDFNRKKSSAFSGMIGQRVASKGVTVVDDGTIPERRGSLTVDDEGTPTARNVLIEDGILVGYMQDRQNGSLMGKTSTGNGRRQSFAHTIMPRMTNTFMLAGPQHPREIIEGVTRGLYAVSFGGGQVDITSGQFVFQATEAYMIEDGRITVPVKGAMIIGSGAKALTKISAIGNDLALDNGIGTCGKNGQGVPVGVGQPTVRLDAMTVGGTRTG